MGRSLDLASVRHKPAGSHGSKQAKPLQSESKGITA